ncbi:hypothetical protein NPIL_627061 [Nephila pilipes]|uniref:Uncharacterized protein n=1 Tax=Nephila pilipes TaxID=299642 RepID=A0A8X6R8J0_NEPPI|nr:hypothetical protein NPIL_627061 [Nephila pilipes]
MNNTVISNHVHVKEIFLWMSKKKISRKEAKIQASTGEESSAQTTQSCNENVERVKFVEEPYVYAKMIESENNDENVNNQYN